MITPEQREYDMIGVSYSLNDSNLVCEDYYLCPGYKYNPNKIKE